MRIDATLISHCNNGINLNEDRMKTTGDRIEQLLRDFGRARYEGAPPYTQVELVEMLTGDMIAPDGKYYKVGTNKSTVNRILRDKQEIPNNILFALCEMFNTDTEWILRGNVLEPEKIPEKFMTDEANEVGAIMDKLLFRSRQLIKTIALNLLAIDNEQREAEVQITALLQENINLLNNGDRKIAADYIARTGTVVHK